MKTKTFSQWITRTGIVAMFCIIFSNSYAANGFITGRVTNSQGAAIVAAEVVANKNSVLVASTFTESNGSYTLSLATGNYDIVIRYVGHVTKTVHAYVQENKTVTVDVSLQVDAGIVPQVHKIGYASPKTEDMMSKPVLSADYALQGKAAGVQMRSNSGTPGSVMNSTIRGMGTTSNSAPLYIVDGVPVGNSYSGNANDVKSVSVLKDASSCAMYGARGANGVVVISTKGNKKGDPQQTLTEIEHNTEEYDKIEENIFKDALISPFSTFSIDVDRASYANVRRFIAQGQKPYADAVRIEEMINYFDYSYPQPTDKHPFTINVESDVCSWNPKNSLVLIGLQGKQLEEKEIPAANLVFLIDVSGSMGSYNKLPLLKQAFSELVSKLREQDKVSIVVYAGAAGVVLEPTSGAHKQNIYDALNRLEAGGSTAGGEGIQLAYVIAKQHFIHGGNNRVILASDGDFNVGVSSTSEMVRMVEVKRNEGIYLTILGFGMGNYKDNRFEQISNAGNGNYAYIDNIMEAKKIFGHELWGTLYTIAKDVKIQVEFNPALVKSYRLIGYENRMLQTEDFINDKKDAGEVGSGHSVTALYEIEYHTQTPTNIDQSKYVKQNFVHSSDVLTVNIRYKQPEDTTSILMQKSVSKQTMPASQNIQIASSVAEFGLLLRNSQYKGTASFAHVLQALSLIEHKDAYGYRRDFATMVEQARKLY